jgi:hypothetical protein
MFGSALSHEQKQTSPKLTLPFFETLDLGLCQKNIVKAAIKNTFLYRLSKK